MDNINKDLVFLLPEQEENIKLSIKDTSSIYQVILWANDLSEENRMQLEAILKAVHIDLSTQVDLITLNDHQRIRYSETYPDSGFLFSFGVSPDIIGFHILPTSYEVIKLNKTKVLFSESLTSVRTQIDSKKKLWSCLKSHFLD